MVVSDSIPGKLDALAVRVGNLERAVAENTELTRDIRDAQIAGRIIGRAAKWLGAIAIAGSAIYAAVYQLTHGGRLPHQ